MSQNKTDAYHKISIPPATQPIGCPVDNVFTPFSSGYLTNPYPELGTLMSKKPIFFSEELGYLVVTGMENVTEVLKNHKVFSSENVQDPVFPVCEEAMAVMSAEDYNPKAVMSNCQPPEHTRIRKFTRDGFNARRMKMLEPYIRETADQLITQMLENESPAEVVSSFAHPLPGQVIFRLIGFPEADDDQLIHWTANRLIFTWGKPTDKAQVEIAENMLKYWRYCRAFVARRHDKPADDLTSELLAHHMENREALSYREVESIIYGLSFAGHEIVSNYISLALMNILPDRALWQSLSSDAGLITKALEEILRFDSPQTSWRRVATEDTRLAGVDIPKGTRIFISLGSANRDPACFNEPDKYNPERDNANRHISFGHGVHFCLGARLARLEAQIALESLVEQMPTLRLVKNQTPSFAPNITFRGPSALYVEWS